jgi:hypothetical protein
MMKRMILAGLIAATAVPVLASTASFDKAASTQDSTSAQVSKSDAAPKHDCSCSHMHHS